MEPVEVRLAEPTDDRPDGTYIVIENAHVTGAGVLVLASVEQPTRTMEVTLSGLSTHLNSDRRDCRRLIVNTTTPCFERVHHSLAMATEFLTYCEDCGLLFESGGYGEGDDDAELPRAEDLE